MQTPMATFMRKGEATPAFLRRILHGVEALVYDDPGLIKEYCSENICILPRWARHPERLVSVAELDPKLKVSSMGTGGAIVTFRACSYSASNASASRSIASSET